MGQTGITTDQNQSTLGGKKISIQGRRLVPPPGERIFQKDMWTSMYPRCSTTRTIWEGEKRVKVGPKYPG